MKIGKNTESPRMKSQLIKFLVFAALVGCSNEEFSGESSTNVQKKEIKKPSLNSTPSTTGSTQTEPNDPNKTLTTDDGGKSQICDPTAMVEDANATEQINGGQQIVNFVNTICGPKLSNNFYGAGSVHNDPLTANAVCRFKGYKSGSVTASGSYSTPHDNFIGKWEGPDVSTIADLSPITGKLQVYPANVSNNQMKGLSCRGKLKAACIPKPQVINCQ